MSSSPRTLPAQPTTGPKPPAESPAHTLAPMAQAWRGTALISALFTLIVAVSMLIGYQRLMAEDPLQVNRLQSLREQLHKNPNDPALKHRIREADLASRQQRWPPTRSGFTPSSPLAN